MPIDIREFAAVADESLRAAEAFRAARFRMTRAL